MKQVFIIHGGDSFSSYDAYLSNLKSSIPNYDWLKPQKKWKNWIAEQLADIDVLFPEFPNKQNASYDEWVIFFEKLIPFFQDDVRLIGHSLGAMFLTKYFNENQLKTPIKQLILVAGQYGKPANGSDVGSFLVDDAKNLSKSAQEIHIFYSEDDPIVDYSGLKMYQSDIPSVITHSFKDRGHFITETFPELLEILKAK